ncbi:DHS-like NAD/FAD-binding domain-containing protein, partial [Lophiotrema nucula]
IDTCRDHLVTSRRILALLGAGLSASSGLPTFRGAGGLWNSHDVKQLATPAAFEEDPALIWAFNIERIKAAREARPNKAHVALAQLARQKPDFLAISMNIDGLSERANHPSSQIHNLHRSLSEVKCTRCQLLLKGAQAEHAISSLLCHPPDQSLQLSDIPHCPSCQAGLLRPGVVWFTESIPQDTLKAIYDWIEAVPTIDTMLVIGTSAEVYPGTAYIEAARKKGARVVVVNIEPEDPSVLGLEEQDWYIRGDAAEMLPDILVDIIGDAG